MEMKDGKMRNKKCIAIKKNICGRTTQKIKVQNKQKGCLGWVADWLIPTWQAVLWGAFLQNPSGIGDEGVEVEQLVHVLPTFCRRLALLRHGDGVRVVHLDRHVVCHVTGAFPRHLKMTVHDIRRYETGRNVTTCITHLFGRPRSTTGYCNSEVITVNCCSMSWQRHVIRSARLQRLLMLSNMLFNSWHSEHYFEFSLSDGSL